MIIPDGPQQRHSEGVYSALRVGNTPLVIVQTRLPDGRWIPLHLKLEGANPGGSIKDRTAVGLFGDLILRSQLRAGSVIVESSSGNLAVALARLARLHDCDFVAVVDDRLPADDRERLEMYGAQLEFVEYTGTDWLDARLKRVQELSQAEGVLWPNQYENSANPLVHFVSTGPEIVAQLDALKLEIATFLISTSTCGTLAGLGHYLRLTRPDAQIIAVDVEGSTIFGGSSGHRVLTGIGSSRSPAFKIQGTYDSVVHVSSSEAISICHAIEASCGLSIGGSSGAVIAAARRLSADREARGIFCLCPDTGANYRQTLFNSAWLVNSSVEVDRRLRTSFGI